LNTPRTGINGAIDRADFAHLGGAYVQSGFGYHAFVTAQFQACHNYLALDVQWSTTGMVDCENGMRNLTEMKQ
jgi:hypothetical protein